MSQCRLRRNPPSQKALPLAKWSRADRETWCAAQEKAGVLDDGGVASHLSARTLDDLTSRYSLFAVFPRRERETKSLRACGRLGHGGKHPGLCALLGAASQFGDLGQERPKDRTGCRLPRPGSRLALAAAHRSTARVAGEATG